MASESEWRQGRDRFVEHDATRERTPRSSGLPSLPEDLGPLAGQFVDLATALLAADTVGAVLQRVVQATREITPGCELASITMRRPDGGFTTPVYTDELAERIDRIQYSADEGPCLEATRADGLGIALCADLAHDTRQWPAFSPAAARMGVGSLLGVGLFPRGDPPRMGALNIYATRAHGLDSVDRDIALLLAAHASVALARTMEVQAAQLEVAQLTSALQSRDVIGQAKGILMERRGVDAGEAFDILRRASQDLNVKLSEIARTVASRRAEL